MKSQAVGLRIALVGFLAMILGTTTVIAGNAEGFVPSDVVATDDVVFPVVSRPTPQQARISPFLATPALDELLAKSLSARLTDCSDEFELQNNSDTEWWIYTEEVWSCVNGFNTYQIDWYWYLYESDGSTPLTYCFASNVPTSDPYPYGGGCSVNYYDYFDYECVGDEEFEVWYRPYGGSWVGPLINDNGPEYGCAIG